MCRKNSDPIHVIFFQSLWLQCALLCLPGSLELGFSWTAHQCESSQVINLAKSKISIFSVNYFVKTLNFHIFSTVRAFDLIPKRRAGNKYMNVIQCDSRQCIWQVKTIWGHQDQTWKNGTPWAPRSSILLLDFPPNWSIFPQIFKMSSS